MSKPHDERRVTEVTPTDDAQAMDDAVLDDEPDLSGTGLPGRARRAALRRMAASEPATDAEPDE